MRRHYLDEASSVPLRSEVRQALMEWLDGPAADPARAHEEGRLVRSVVEEARECVAGFVGVRPSQVVFTSGATESINTATASAAAKTGAILCAEVEHSAVREASRRHGEVVTIPVDSTGRISLNEIGKRISTDVALVHCQWGNHEVGTLQPVESVVALCAESGVPVHVDAAAAAGRIGLDLGALGAAFVSISSHKLGGPPGIGALIVGRGVRLSPLLVGAVEERGRRAGMENVPGIVGFGAAAAALTQPGRVAGEAARSRHLIATLLEGALTVDGVGLVGDPDPTGRLPHIACIGVEGVEAEPILLGLDRAGVAVHSGSACASETWEPSPVLEAMGVPSNHSLRISVGHSTADADIAAFADAFADIVAGLRSLRGG